MLVCSMTLQASMTFTQTNHLSQKEPEAIPWSIYDINHLRLNQDRVLPIRTVIRTRDKDYLEERDPCSDQWFQ